MRFVRVHPEAELEAGDAVDWYESRSSSVGWEFRDEVAAILRMLRGNDIVPSTLVQGRLGKRGVRRLRVGRFPYNAIFTQRDGDIEVLAFAHHKRRPGYWRNLMRQGGC